MSETVTTTEHALDVIQYEVGPCREWIGQARCNQPAEYVLWGKLIPPDALGPRCYDCAAKHLGHGFTDPSWAVIDLARLARKLSEPS